MIASHVDGRLRLRAGESENVSLLENVRKSLLNLDGVREVIANLRTGSLLVFYDTSPTVKEGVLQTVTPYLGSPAEVVPSRV